MRYTFFTNTPAHVHLYRNATWRLDRTGHDLQVLARDYECTLDLLEYYDLPFEVYGGCGDTKLSLFASLPTHFVNIARAVRRFRPDLVFGMGAYSTFAGLVADAPAVLIIDSEPTTVDHALSRPFAKTILTPTSFRKDLGPNHYEFRGFKECAYLHPDVFEPDRSVRSDLGLAPNERYVVVRFNAFGSHHDIGHRGFSRAEREALVERLADHATVIVSGDDHDGTADDHPSVRRYQLHPARIHDVLSGASLLVADSQTMVTEAALLGTPAIRSNSFVGGADMGNFVELERQGLVWNLRSFDEVLEAAVAVLTDEEIAERWAVQRDAYVSDLVNLTDVICDVAVRGGATTRSDLPALRPAVQTS